MSIISTKENLLLIDFQYKGEPFVRVALDNIATDTRGGALEANGELFAVTEKLTFHYLTIVLSNCTYNGNVFMANIEDLESALQTQFMMITNLEFRGVGCSMVRGDTDSLTLGVAAGYYSTKQSLTEAEALSLRVAINEAISNISGFNASEVRVESTLIQKSKYLQ